MSRFEAGLNAPATARYHREAVEQILDCVEERVYCALLGPRLCGKTLLLRYIEQNLANLLGWTCTYIDLQTVRTSTQQAFFADLIQACGEQISQLTGQVLPLPEEDVASSVVFRAFLFDCLEILQRDLVLIIDPLEALPTDLVQALLTSLRAAYMDQQTYDYQVTVVVSGALSLATVAVGESSPFRGIARRVFVGDLSPDDSREFILELLSDQAVSATEPAVQKLLATTSGDIYLMRSITQRCAQLVSSRTSQRLRSGDVTHVTNKFLREEVYQYAPLVEAIRLIEENPDLVTCILQLLAQEQVTRSALPLPLSPDLDPLYLTGVVENTGEDCYRLQNLIYRRFLAQHFSPGRVGHVLAMAGRWDSAIDYLEASILQGNPESRSDLLPAIIHSIYASQDLAQAVHFMRRGMSAAFGVRNTQFWFIPSQENFLRLIGPADLNQTGEAWTDLQIPIQADRLEARAYRQQVPLRGQEGEGQIVRAIPLMIPGSAPLGVVIINEDPANDPFIELRERETQMAGFLNQAARAFQTVSSRRQELALAGRVQASLLPDSLPSIPNWEIATAWRPARETSGDFYDFVPLPADRIGIVIADVVDKGMGAALLMTLSRTLLRTFAADYPNHPEQLLGKVNQRIISDLNAGLFVTLFYGILEPATGKLIYSNAGHPPPFMFHPIANHDVETLDTTGMPLGIAEDSTWTAGKTQIPAGGLLLLYTDGVLDAQNPRGEFFGQEQLLKKVQDQIDRPIREIQDGLVSAVYAFAATERQVDDITMMMLVRGNKNAILEVGR